MSEYKTTPSSGRFDHTLGEWIIGKAHPEDIQRDTLTLATFNIWFDDYFAMERHQAIADILELHRPDFIALQEVTYTSLNLFLSQKWIQQEYFTTDFDGSTFSDYGVLLPSRIPPEVVKLIRLPSFMGRDLLTIQININGSTLSVAAVHLESMRSSSDIRGDQLETIFKTLKTVPNAVIMGDFNFCATWPDENDRIDLSYGDLWEVLRGDEPGYTEDTSINHMRYQIKGKHKQVRFDRILLKTANYGPGWTASSIELLGTRPISSEYPDVFPSDHFGLICRITRR